MAMSVLTAAASNSVVNAENSVSVLSEHEITTLRKEAVVIAQRGDIPAGLSELEKLYNQARDNTAVIADYIVVLVWDENWPKAVAVYEENAEKDLPLYVLPEVAKAYSRTLLPNQGLELYEKYLNAYPDDFNSQSGIVRILIHLRAYARAQQYIDRLITKHPQNIEFYLLKSDLFIVQNRLPAAQDVLNQALDVDPENLAVQANLAQVYLWRGWPRMALALFTKLYEITTDNVLINNGYANALNAVMYKKKAREIIAELHMARPEIANYARTKREFAVEDMPGLRSSIRYGHETRGEDEVLITTRFDYPVANCHQFFTSFVRRMITQSEVKNDILHKLYLGDQWQPDERWLLIGAVSDNASNTPELGGMGQIVHTPDDYWSGSFFFESGITDVPLRSHNEGTSVDEYRVSLAFRPSDLFNSKAGVDFQEFSDGNRNKSYFWNTDSFIIAREKWSLRVGSETYYSTFSKQDVSYFAPRSRFSWYLIPRLEHLWFRKSGRAFVERYYAGGGQVWQNDFSAKTVGFARYEQEHTITDTLSVVLGAAYYLNNYDGAFSTRLNADAAIRISF